MSIRLLVNNRPLSHYPIDPSFPSHYPYIYVNIQHRKEYDAFIRIYIYITIRIHYTVQIYLRLDNSHRYTYISCSYVFFVTVPLLLLTLHPLTEYCLSSSV